MKNVICILILGFLITSCGDDDDLAGTYRLTELAQSNCNDMDNNFVLNFENAMCDTIASGSVFCEDGTLNISDDGNYTSTVTISAPNFGTIFSFNQSGTYVSNDGIVTLCNITCTDFTLSDGRLITNDDGFGCDQAVHFTKN